MTKQKLNSMNKESGMAQFQILLAVIIVVVIIAFLVTVAQAIMTLISHIPLLGGLAYTIPNALAGILRSFQGLASWALQGHFVSVGVTDLAQMVGWDTVRSLANIFLLLGLIFTAFGIMLGIKEYEAKKSLPILILIALLINFTPVICGWIIDFSNYITDWLLKGAIPSDEFAAMVEGDNVPKNLTSIFVFCIFVITAIFVYLLFFILFLIRYIFLLVLTIFSPIAFASKIFSPSEKAKKFFPSFLYWDTWWNQFLQWCTVGILASFFMLIGNQIMLNMDDIQGTNPGGFMGAIIIYFLPVLALLIGFFSTLEAAQGVTGLITSNAAKLGGFLAAGTKLAKPVARPLKDVGENLAMSGYEKLEKAPLGAFKREVTELNIAKKEEVAQEIEKRKDKFIKMDATTRFGLADKKSPQDMSAVLMATAEKGDEEKILEGMNDDERKNYEKQRNEILQYLEKVDYKGYKETVKRSPHWIADDKKRKETFASLPPSFIKEKIGKESFKYLKENKEEAKEVASSFSVAQLKAITAIEDQETRQIAQETIEEALKKSLDENKLKPHMKHYLTETTEGRSLFGLSQKENKSEKHS
ncbi:MAG: hypothetical protein WBJ22_00550 [Minisyncoccales bacterium]